MANHAIRTRLNAFLGTMGRQRRQFAMENASAAAQCDNLPDDAQSNFFRGCRSEVKTSRSPYALHFFGQHSFREQVVKHQPRAMRAGHQSNVRGVTLQGFLQPEMIVFVQGRDYDECTRTESDLRNVKISVDDTVRGRKFLALCGRIMDGNAEVHQVAEAGQCYSDLSMSGDD